MRSLFCRINTNNKPIDENSFHQSVIGLSEYKETSNSTCINKTTAFGQLSFNKTSAKIIENNEFTIISDSRLDNNSDTDCNLILRTYEEKESKCPEYLSGDFAFIIWNKKLQELFCARDHFGIKPLYYYLDNQTLIISSEISAILKQDDISVTIDEQYVADTLSIIKSENAKTLYKEIKKIPPAHYLNFKNNKLEIKKYWKLEPKKYLELPDEEVINQFKTLLLESVKNRVDSENNFGSELSGGIDSSSITSLASKHKAIKTFSHIMPDDLLGKIHPFKDERKFIKSVYKFCNIENHFYIKSEESGILEAINVNISDYNHIGQQNFSAFSDQLYKQAHNENISVLLSGFGGDEIITSKSGNYLEELARNGQWRELKNDLKESNLSVFQCYKALIKYQFKVRCPKLYGFISKLKSKDQWWENKFENLALNQDFIQKMNIKSRYYSYYSNANADSLQERNIEKITHPHVAQRLEYCNTSARKYGIEYRYPFLDKRLIEFYLSISPRLKARNGIKRYAIREAMKKLLPEKIRLRNDKSGATIPTVLVRALKDENQIIEIINQAKTNPKIKKYINLDKYEEWFNKLMKRSGKDKYVSPGAFYNYLKLILFIEQNPNLF